MRNTEHLGDKVLEIYVTGTSEHYRAHPQNKGSIDMGDSCIVVGGKAYIDSQPDGDRILTAWPTLESSDTYLSFSNEDELLRSVLPQRLRTIEPDHFKPLHLSNADRYLMAVLGLSIDEEHSSIHHGALCYRGIESHELDALRALMQKTFSYEGPSTDLLSLVSQSGGHVAGIFDNEVLSGFVTAFASRDRYQNPQLFIDMIGVNSDLHNRSLGKFGIRAAALAGTAWGCQQLSLTFDGANPKLAHFYTGLGFQPVGYIKDIYGPGISRLFAELDCTKPFQRTRLSGNRIPISRDSVLQTIAATEASLSDIQTSLIKNGGNLAIVDYDRGSDQYVLAEKEAYV